MEANKKRTKERDDRRGNYTEGQLKGKYQTDKKVLKSKNRGPETEQEERGEKRCIAYRNRGRQAGKRLEMQETTMTRRDSRNEEMNCVSFESESWFSSFQFKIAPEKCLRWLVCSSRRALKLSYRMWLKCGCFPIHPDPRYHQKLPQK